MKERGKYNLPFVKQLPLIVGALLKNYRGILQFDINFGDPVPSPDFDRANKAYLQ